MNTSASSPGIDDTFIRMGERKGWATHPVLVILLCQVFYCVILLGGPLETAVVAAEQELGPVVGQVAGVAVTLVASLLPYVPVVLWLRFVERRRPFVSTGLRFDRRALSGLGAGIGAAALFVAGWIGLGTAAGSVSFAGFGDLSAGALGLLPVAVLLALLMRVVLIGVEEQMYRGWLLQAAGARWGMVAGVLVSSFFFALWHFAWIGMWIASLWSVEGRLHEPHWVLALNIYLWSVFAALWTLRARSLWPAVGFHAAALILPMSAVAVLTPDAPEHASGPVMFMIDEPSHYAGGAGHAGLFEGLPATALLLVLVALAAAALYRRARR